MDELKIIWSNVAIEEIPTSENDVSDMIRLKSTGIVWKLRQKVKSKLWWAVGLTALFTLMTPWVIPIFSQGLLLILIAAYLTASILLYHEHKILTRHIDMSVNLKTALNDYLTRIKRVIRYEEIVSLCLYPVSITAGFLYGLQLASSDQKIMNQPLHWIFLISSMIFLTIIGNIITRWLNRRNFDSYIDQLQQNLEELED